MKKFNTQYPLSPLSPLSHRIRTVCLIAAMLVIAACSSVRLSYNNGETLLYWWLNAYTGFDSAQKGGVRQDIDQLFEWHRKTQLKDYARLLTTGRKQLQGNVTQADLLADYSEIKSSTQLLMLKALPDLADLARSLRPEQITQMEKKFASNNNDYRKKFLRGDTAKRQQVRYQKSMEQFELWFGNFSSEQEAKIRIASDLRPLDNQIWFDERVLRQKKIIAVLNKIQNEKLGKEATVAQIQNLIKETFDRLDHSEHKAFFDASTGATANLVVAVVRLATPAQKAHAQERMQGWIDDFDSLAAEAK
jgi:hypothetical protein